MNAWLAVAFVGVLTIAIKAVGPVGLGGRELPPRVLGVVEAMAPALLAALVATATLGSEQRLVFDERLLGLAAAAVAMALRAPVLVILAAAAVTTAVARAVG